MGTRDREVGMTGLLLRRLALRHWQAAPRQSALLVLILALGIAVFLSIRLANRAALASFQNFTELITEESDWLIQPPAGFLPEEVLAELRDAVGASPVRIVPVLETTAARPQVDPNQAIGAGEAFQVLGVDLIGIQNLAIRQARDRSWFGQAADTNAAAAGTERFWNVFGNPRAVFVSAALAARDGLRPGGPLPLVINDRVVELEVAGVIPSSPETPEAPLTLLVMDLPAVQQLTGNTGRLSRVEFMVEEGPGAARDPARAGPRSR